jgi:GT2 family glycosyltransferase
VVVPTFNSADHIHACLSSVCGCLPDAEVIVVDNGSTDETRELVRASFPTVTLLSGHGNVGFGSACNLGAQLASNEYLLYLNPDAEIVSVDDDALARLTASRPLGMVAATLVDKDQPLGPRVRRLYSHWLVEFLVPHVLRVLSSYAPRFRYAEEAEGRGRFTVDGAIFFVAASEFDRLGGFDERFFMYSEDADLAQRYRQGGYPLRGTSGLLARHEGGTSAPTPKLLALSFLGWLEYTHKWHGRATAMRAAVFSRAVYSLVLSALRGLALVIASKRVAAKAEQLAAMLSYIATEGLDGDLTESQPRYQTAGPIAARTFRSFAPSGSDRAAS